jgi:transposase
MLKSARWISYKEDRHARLTLSRGDHYHLLVSQKPLLSERNLNTEVTQMGLYCGIDLHSNNNFLGIYDEQDRRVFTQRLNNQLEQVLGKLEPYRSEIVGIVVESTYNWYWLVDGLMDNGYKVVLANPAGNEQYSGLKYTDDKYDTQWLAQLFRLGILATGYIYPKEDRSIRDLLRKRIRLVQHRTSHIVSVLNIVSRHTGRNLKWRMLEEAGGEQLEELIGADMRVMAPRASLEVIAVLNQQISTLERAALSQAKLRNEFKLLKTIHGIGSILALTIMYETGDISRFPKVGDYCSYARCVTSKRMSNQKKKGKNNTKNGNRYLAWAFVEAANFAARFYDGPKRFAQRKAAKSNHTLAMKALAHKLARAGYYVMRDQVEFQAELLFR